MRKKSLGKIAIALLVLVNLILWFTLGPSDDGRRDNYARQLVGEIIGSTAMILMACALLLATRAKVLEPYFGGLDQMYQAHKQAAMLSVFLLFAHFFTLPLDPNHMKPGSPLGMLAFFGVLLLVMLTVAPRIPLIGRFTRFAYHKWRQSHRAIGVFFIIGFGHAMLVDPMIRSAPAPFTFLVAMFVIGAASYLYAILFSRLLRKRLAYNVAAVTRLNGTTVEVTLAPRKQPLKFTAGQFVFLHFDGDPTLAEPHPFTVSSAPHAANLRFSIKSSGDWTQAVFDRLEPGSVANISCAYGMFDYRTGRERQVWVAGGIGITPFLSWIRDFRESPPARDIDFFYVVRSADEALFLAELEEAGRQHASFRVHVSFANQVGHLSAEGITASSGQITDKDVYICGPIAMTNALQKGFAKLGLPAEQIHFEEFNFR